MTQKILLIAFFCLQLVACGNFNSSQKFEFYYYPARNVYYDVANAEFVFSVNAGKTWETFQKDLGKDPATLGAREVIYSDSQQPWTNNAEDVKKYNGKVYNLPVESDTSSQTEIVSNKKIIKKTKPVDSIQPEEKKEGFFRRLFGGKKKKN